MTGSARMERTRSSAQGAPNRGTRGRTNWLGAIKTATWPLATDAATAMSVVTTYTRSDSTFPKVTWCPTLR